MNDIRATSTVSEISVDNCVKKIIEKLYKQCQESPGTSLIKLNQGLFHHLGEYTFVCL